LGARRGRRRKIRRSCRLDLSVLFPYPEKEKLRGRGSIPVYTSSAPVFCLEGRGDVGVDPERPEGVVEVKDEHFWEGEAVGEGLGDELGGRGG